eukprot:COSAG02_NODE_5927_length_3937_cov_2.933299_1_plen_66_part_00
MQRVRISAREKRGSVALLRACYWTERRRARGRGKDEGRKGGRGKDEGRKKGGGGEGVLGSGRKAR